MYTNNNVGTMVHLTLYLEPIYKKYKIILIINYILIYNLF